MTQEITKDKLSIVEKALDEAFLPFISRIQNDRRLIEEYYDSGLTLTKFCISRQLSVFYLQNVLRKYKLPSKVRRIQ